MKFVYDIIKCPECGYTENRTEDQDVFQWTCPKCGHSGGTLERSDHIKTNVGIRIIDNRTGWYKYSASGESLPSYNRLNPGQPIEGTNE